MRASVHHTSAVMAKASQVSAVCWNSAGPRKGRSDRIGTSIGWKGVMRGGEDTSGSAVR